MTNKIYLFPPAPSGAHVCRSDRLPEIRRHLTSLVIACRNQNVHVLHKPYNDATLREFAAMFAELGDLGGDFYEQLGTGHKGLTPDLLDQCEVVLWDQPGTGFLECLAGGIPTMVFWPRTYVRETPAAQPAFARLGDAGIVHRTTASLLAEYGRFRSSPAAWMRNPTRIDAIQSFARQYGWADDGWPTIWREFLDRLLEGNIDEMFSSGSSGHGQRTERPGSERSTKQ